jgi:hypothetical protein
VLPLISDNPARAGAVERTDRSDGWRQERQPGRLGMDRWRLYRDLIPLPISESVPGNATGNSLYLRSILRKYGREKGFPAREKTRRTGQSAWIMWEERHGLRDLPGKCSAADGEGGSGRGSDDRGWPLPGASLCCAPNRGACVRTGITEDSCVCRNSQPGLSTLRSPGSAPRGRMMGRSPSSPAPSGW